MTRDALEDPDSGSAAVLVTVDVVDPSARGRCFTSLSRLRDLNMDLLSTTLLESFADEEDEERIRMISRLAARVETLDVVALPGVNGSPEWHVYVYGASPRSPRTFACVLVDTATIRQMLQRREVVFETATLQVIDGPPTPASLTAGVESWLRRLLPSAGRHPMPVLRRQALPWSLPWDFAAPQETLEAPDFLQQAEHGAAA